MYYSWPFQNVYILDNSRNFNFWTIPEFLHSGPFTNFYILNCSRICMFWTCSELFSMDHYRNFTIWTISDFLHLWLWLINREFLNSGLFKNFYIWIVPEFACLGPFHNFLILEHSWFFAFWMKVSNSARWIYVSAWVKGFLKIYANYMDKDINRNHP